MKKKEFNLGHLQGYSEGESSLGLLILKLSEEGRYDEVRRAASDEQFRKECYKKYGIK
ncbi:MAG: hypothetical protein NC355_04070 [Blautia sp.]|nr:hypothetical protein [Blautia sp.]